MNREGKNLLITYIENFGWFDERNVWISHPDPTFETEWSYCTGYKRLLKCGKGNYIFFHTTKTDPISEQRERFITAYFVIKDVGLGKVIVPRYNIVGAASHAEKIKNHYVIVGDNKLSRELKEPGLKFDKSLAKKLMFDHPKRIQFDITNKYGQRLSELQCIASATRNIRVLTDVDVKTLLLEINHLRL